MKFQRKVGAGGTAVVGLAQRLDIKQSVEMPGKVHALID